MPIDWIVLTKNMNLTTCILEQPTFRQLIVMNNTSVHE